jgi:hypothetical protein
MARLAAAEEAVKVLDASPESKRRRLDVLKRVNRTVQQIANTNGSIMAKIETLSAVLRETRAADSVLHTCVWGQGEPCKGPLFDDF